MVRLAGILRRAGLVARVSVAYAVIFAACLTVPARRLMRTVGRGIGQPEAFCAGTTAAYRKGNGTNSALTPLITPAPIGQPCLDLHSMHPIWRAGFDTCHGSDICDGNNWANLWTDAVAPEWYAAILFALSLLLMICNAILAYKKHAAGLSISWKVVAVMALLWLPVPISKAVVSMPARALRFTAYEVAGLPSLISVHPLSTRRLCLPRFFCHTVLRDGRERQGLRQQPGGAEGSRSRSLDRQTR